MKQNNNMQFERHVKAPTELKKRTFKKIEKLSIVLELLGFYSSIPRTFFNSEDDSRTK
jgi:hypothetical protein